MTYRSPYDLKLMNEIKVMCPICRMEWSYLDANIKVIKKHVLEHSLMDIKKYFGEWR